MLLKSDRIEAPIPLRFPFNQESTPMPTSLGIFRGASSRRLHLFLMTLAMGVLALLLSGCGELSTTTEVNADGSGIERFSVKINSGDMEKVQGGVETIESVVNEKNPGGFTFDGSDKDSEGNTIVKVSLAFDSPDDYTAKAKTALEASGITETPEVIFEPPKPPFTTGVTFARSFGDEELVRWISQGVMDASQEEKNYEASEMMNETSTKVVSNGKELETTYLESDIAMNAWSDSEKLTFDDVTVETAAFDDPSEKKFKRTIHYTLSRETYRKASEDFDKFFESAVPEGGELKAASATENVWTVSFPAGSPEEISKWTDTALASKGSEFSVSDPTPGEDPFVLTTSVVSNMECTVACSEGGLQQTINLGTTEADAAMIPVGPEPYSVSRSLSLTAANIDVQINRDGGGKLEAKYSLSEADDALITEATMTKLLGGDASRKVEDGTATYTVTISGKDSSEFTSALAKAGYGEQGEPPAVTVVENPSEHKKYLVDLDMHFPEALSEHLPQNSSWTIKGDGIAPTAVLDSSNGTSSMADDAITVKSDGGSYLMLSFAAERRGLDPIEIFGIAAVIGVALLVIAGTVLAIVYRNKLKNLFNRPAATA